MNRNTLSRGKMILSYAFWCLVMVQTALANNNQFINRSSSSSLKNDEVNDDYSTTYEEKETFSKLNFNNAQGNPTVLMNEEEQYESKESTLTSSSSSLVEDTSKNQNDSFWGRLYIDGFPGQMQYFRAHFGGLPPPQRVKFKLAQPLNYCDDVQGENNNAFDSDTIIVAKRGNCTFVEKAQRAYDNGAGGILFINNEVCNCKNILDHTVYCNTFILKHMFYQE